MEPDFNDVVPLVSAICLGPREVGMDAPAEVFAAVGMYGLTAPE
ncbi:hypothetical protein QWM81_20415 [Streptomyces ficellus]|uniref:Uncharacterized protein n=1 Tax=Streptomyces ficellus TaxID=1977088 RepID=A0ABT7ZAU8_9ACTN|nr:hypothetical protein [Streptomyces ficellus]